MEGNLGLLFHSSKTKRDDYKPIMGKQFGQSLWNQSSPTTPDPPSPEPPPSPSGSSSWGVRWIGSPSRSRLFFSMMINVRTMRSMSTEHGFNWSTDFHSPAKRPSSHLTVVKRAISVLVSQQVSWKIILKNKSFIHIRNAKGELTIQPRPFRVFQQYSIASSPIK